MGVGGEGVSEGKRRVQRFQMIVRMTAGKNGWK